MCHSGFRAGFREEVKEYSRRYSMEEGSVAA